MSNVTTRQSVEDKANNKRRMTVGIHKGYYDRSELKTVGDQGKQIIEVWFVDTIGTAEQKKTIWLPSDNPKVPEGKSLEQAIKDDQKRFSDELVDILACFFPPERQILSASSWDGIANKFIKQMDEVKGKKPVNLLVHWDYKFEYAEFPRYNWITPFVEGSPHGFDLTSQYVRMTKPGENSFVSGYHNSDSQASTPATGGADSSDDLPF